MKIEIIKSLEKIPSRRADAHKGDFGRVLVVGGSLGMSGAVALAANATLLGGAGLVTFAVPRTVHSIVAGLCPCATSIALDCNDDGMLSAEAVGQVLSAAKNCDVLALGPGLGVGTVEQNIVRAVLEQEKPLVLDADALNNLANIERWPEIRNCPTILTPHPGEFAWLTGQTIKEIQSDRQNSAVRQTQQWLAQGGKDSPALVCVLKGAGSVVTDGWRVYVNDTGNPAMASGGSGDVLTGLVGAFMGQGLEPFLAACQAVRCHGRAGDLGTEKFGPVSLTAVDLLDYLPGAIKEACE